MTNDQRERIKAERDARVTAAAPEMFQAIKFALDAFRLDGKIEGERAKEVKAVLTAAMQKTRKKDSQENV